MRGLLFFRATPVPERLSSPPSLPDGLLCSVPQWGQRAAVQKTLQGPGAPGVPRARGMRAAAPPVEWSMLAEMLT